MIIKLLGHFQSKANSPEIKKQVLIRSLEAFQFCLRSQTIATEFFNAEFIKLINDILEE